MSRPERIDAALFDFDGTLCDTEPSNLAFLRRLMEEFGAPVTDEEVRSFAGAHPDEVIPPLLRKHGSSRTYEEFVVARDDLYPAYATADLRPMPGSVELLRDLRSRGVRLAVVTTGAARCVLTALARMGMLPLFDAIVTGEMSARPKPAPDPYLEGLRLLGADAAHAVAFEDSPSGIRSAQAAGIHAIGFAGGSVATDMSGADEVVAGYEGLSL